MIGDSWQLLLEFALGCLVWASVAQIVNSVLLFLQVGLAAATSSWVLPVS